MQAMYRRTGKPINIELNNIISISSKLSFSNFGFVDTLRNIVKSQSYLDFTIIPH